MRKTLHHIFIPHQGNAYHPHILRTPILHGSALMMIGLKVSLALLFYLVYPDVSAFAKVNESHLIIQTNEFRKSRNLSPLKESQILNAVALEKARHMLDKQYFDHIGPNGETPWQFMKKNGYVYSYAGENLAMNFADSKEVTNAWLASPKHQANIVNEKYEDIGIAVVTGMIAKKQTTVVVQLFGKTYLPKTEDRQMAQRSLIEANGQVFPEGEVSGFTTYVGLQNRTRIPFFKSLVTSFSTTLSIVLGFFILAFLLNIFIHIRVQRGRVIVQSLMVLFLLASLFIIKFHWIEMITGPLIL